MTIVLYELVGANGYTRFSPHCWKAHLALNHLSLPFVSTPVHYHQIKDTLAFANYALLPVLTDGDTTVTDSWNIACYLDEQHSQRGLFFDDAGQALAESTNHWCDTVLAKHIRPLVLLAIYDLLHEQDRDYFRQSREQRLGMTLGAFSSQAPAATDSLLTELDSVRDILTMQPYLHGPDPGYADICLLSMLMWIACVKPLTIFDENDSVYRWYQAMLKRYPDAHNAVQHFNLSANSPA